MSRIPETSTSLAADLASRLERLVAAARKEGRDQALAEVRSLIAGGGRSGAIPAPAKKRGRPLGSKNRPKAEEGVQTKGKKRRNSRAGLSPEARLARVNTIRRGKGLPAKSGL